MKETQEFNCWTSLDAVNSHSSLQRSRRLVESVSNILLFSSLDRKDLDLVCKAANLLVCNPGRPIFGHGEWGDSLYIILDGRMRVFTYDHQGKDITLQLLGENHFFGESSLLTGNPHMTSVEALEETLLCKLRFETIRDLAERHPVIKGLLEQSHRDRLNYIESRRESVGFERRKHPRYEIPLTVIFSVSTGLSLSDTFQRKTFQGISTDISLAGVRVRLKDKSLGLLPIGCNVRLESVLPPPWQSIRCIGIVRYMMETDEGDDRIHIGIEFSEVSATTQKILENFLYSCVTAKA
jgi:CRP-like cAMP-binding protein